MEIIVNGGETLYACDFKKIYVYGHGEILCYFTGNSISEKKLTVNKSGEKKLESAIYDKQIRKIRLSNPVRTARKENLFREDNFTMKYKGEYSFEDGRALYIHESEISVEDLGDILAMETEEERDFLHTYRLRFTNPVTYDLFHYERIPTDDDWTLPENGEWSTCYGTEEKPCYDTYNDFNYPEDVQKVFASKGRTLSKGVIKRYITVETEEGFEAIVCDSGYSKMVYSVERIRKDNIAKRLNESGEFHSNSFSHYDITKLEKALGYKLS